MQRISNVITMVKRVFHVAIVILSLVVGACNESPALLAPNGVGNIVLPDGRVSYSLHTHAPAFVRPASRTGTANEADATGAVWVFVFNASQPDTTLLEVVKATDHQSLPTQGQSKRTVILSKREHAVTLLVIANAPSVIFTGTANSTITDAASWRVVPGTSLATARALLSTVLLDAPAQSTVPYASGELIPMSAQLQLAELSPSTPLGSEAMPLGLQRVVAKIVVQTDFTSAPDYTNPPFLLRGATLHNAPRNASLFPCHKENASNLTDYMGAPNSEVIGIAQADGVTTILNPIYAYPSAQALAEQQSFVLIQARYGNDAHDTYYKLAFNTIATRRGRIERNAYYTFRIARCDGSGYASLQEAIDNPPANLQYNVAVTDLSSHDLIDNGQYYIGLSNSEYHIYSSGAMDNLEAAILNTGTNVGAVLAPAVGTITSSDPTNLMVRNGSFAHAVAERAIVIGITDAFTAGRLTVRLGNLTKEIEVKRMADAYVPLKDELVVNQNYSAPIHKVASVALPQEWIKVGFSPNVTLESGLDVVTSAGGVYIAYNTIKSLTATENSVYISRSYGGRIKAHFFIAPSPF